MTSDTKASQAGTSHPGTSHPRTGAEARALIAGVLARIAPEVDLATCDPSAELAVELDLDSMDFLTMVTQLAQRTGQDIPERDYGQLATLDGLVTYLVERSG
jgi:acyl carrier protein